MTIKRNNIRLLPREISDCNYFGERTCGKAWITRINRGECSSSISKVKSDIVIGKIAETAVAVFLDMCDSSIEPKVNFEVYDSGIGDVCDFMINGYRIEVKSSRFPGNLLVAEDELLRRKAAGTLPHVYIYAYVHVDPEKDEPTGDVTIYGYHTTLRMFEDGKNIECISKGERLTSYGKPLTFNAVCSCRNDLYSWKAIPGLLAAMKSKPPFDTDCLKLPEFKKGA